MSRTFSLSLLPLLTAILPLTLFGQTCTKATCTAASANEADVLAALPSPSNTNSTVVVNIPSGTSSWTSAFKYTVPSAVTDLTVQGATVVTCTGTAGSSGYSCSSTDHTVIQDGFAASSPPLITFVTGSSSTHFRITGITIVEESGSSKSDGMLYIVGSSHNIRMDHLHVNANGQNNSMVEMEGPTLGVIDHNDVELGNQYNVANGFRNYASSDGYGDAAWNSATQWGTASSWYLEANYFNGGSPTDCYNGANYVIRYNTINNAYVLAIHGTKNDAGRGRGCRLVEMYHNYFSGSGGNANAIIGPNAGPALMWGNNVASGYNHFNVPGAPRDFSGGDSGSTPWDGMCSPSLGGPSYYDGSGGYPCLDGIGRGQGNLLSGDTATPHAWPNQYLEPEYMFMNTLAAADEGYINDASTQVNRDVYADCNGAAFDGVTCSSFNGTHGTGYGLASARPSTCTAGPGGTYGASPTGSYGVAYWATDANGGKGELYVCTATNTWTGIYTPYTYPHPLDGGSTTGGSAISPSAPTGLTGSFQ